MNITKGEWYHLIDKENRYHVMSHGKSGDMQQNIAIMSVRPEAKGNANLIAAAPDMYEALKAFDEYVSTNHPANIRLKQIAIDRMERAIAKAEGG